jgi:RNA polymerase sigma-70 factor (ECF subfamily)
VLQATIASLHAEGGSDWPRIVAVYDQLAQLTGSPVVALNRAVALAEADGAEAGLEAIEPIAGELDGYHYLHAARGELLLRLGRSSAARQALVRALELVRSEPERRLLRRRLDSL